MNPAMLMVHRVDKCNYGDLHDGLGCPSKWVSVTNAPYSYAHSIPQMNVSIPSSAKAAAFVIKASSDLSESGT